MGTGRAIHHLPPAHHPLDTITHIMYYYDDDTAYVLERMLTVWQKFPTKGGGMVMTRPQKRLRIKF